MTGGRPWAGARRSPSPWHRCAASGQRPVQRFHGRAAGFEEGGVVEQAPYRLARQVGDEPHLTGTVDPLQACAIPKRSRTYPDEPVGFVSQKFIFSADGRACRVPVRKRRTVLSGAAGSPCQGPRSARRPAPRWRGSAPRRTRCHWRLGPRAAVPVESAQGEGRGQPARRAVLARLGFSSTDVEQGNFALDLPYRGADAAATLMIETLGLRPRPRRPPRLRRAALDRQAPQPGDGTWRVPEAQRAARDASTGAARGKLRPTNHRGVGRGA